MLRILNYISNTLVNFENIYSYDLTYNSFKKKVCCNLIKINKTQILFNMNINAAAVIYKGEVKKNITFGCYIIIKFLILKKI